MLQGDVDEVMSMVRRLHGRLSDAACWTRNLQEDTEASREKITSLIAQVTSLNLCRCVLGCRSVFAKAPSDDSARASSSRTPEHTYIATTSVNRTSILHVHRLLVWRASWRLGACNRQCRRNNLRSLSTVFEILEAVLRRCSRPEEPDHSRWWVLLLSSCSCNAERTPRQGGAVATQGRFPSSHVSSSHETATFPPQAL